MDNERVNISLNEYAELLHTARDCELLVCAIFSAAEGTTWRDDELTFNVDKLNTLLAFLCPREYAAKVNVLIERKAAKND